MYAQLLIEYVEMFRRTVSQTSVYPREIVKEATVRNWAALILERNHPSGLAEPPRADEVCNSPLEAIVDGSAV